jgi:hypothetical protein
MAVPGAIGEEVALGDAGRKVHALNLPRAGLGKFHRAHAERVFALEKTWAAARFAK